MKTLKLESMWLFAYMHVLSTVVISQHGVLSRFKVQIFLGPLYVSNLRVKIRLRAMDTTEFILCYW